MLQLITFLTASKWGKYVLEVAVVAALLFGAYKYAEHQGSKNQRDKDDQASSSQIEQSRREAKEANEKVVKLANDRAEAAEKRAGLAEQQSAQLAMAFTALDRRSAEAQKGVDKLADSELHADIVGKLDLRPANDPAQGYYPKEERAIDTAVTQKPILEDKVQNLAQQASAKDAEAKANRDAADARKQAYDADEAYIALLSKFFAQVYNQHPPRYRSLKCLGLWGCGKAIAMPEIPRRGQ